MRINVLSHTKAALNESANIEPEEKAEKLAQVARQILADLAAEVPDYVTRDENEEFVVELELEKAAADGVDICLHYMRVLALYTACFWSDGFLGLSQSFDLGL